MYFTSILAFQAVLGPVFYQLSPRINTFAHFTLNHFLLSELGAKPKLKPKPKHISVFTIIADSLDALL